MNRFTSRRVATTMILTLCGAGTALLAAEQLLSVQVPTSPPKEYVIPKKGVSDAIRTAVDNPNRRPEDRARDGYRMPAELMALTGVKPGSKVVEFGTFGELDRFGQYYTTMLADVVGPKGVVYMYDSKDVDGQLGANSRAFAAAHPNTKYEAVDYNKIEIPKGIDVVWSVLNYHELLKRNVDMTAFYNKIFKAMRPGAVFLIVDHVGVSGADMKATLPLHRIEPSYIKQGAGAAGFGLAVESRLLYRGGDDHKWDVYTDGKADQTDQIVYLFRKPIVY